MASVNEALLNDLEKTANHLTGIAAQELGFAEAAQAGWSVALKSNVAAQNAWTDLLNKAAGYLSILAPEQIQGTVDSYLAAIISHASAERTALKTTFNYLEKKIAFQVSFDIPAVPTRMPYQQAVPFVPSQRTPAHDPCPTGTMWDPASGMCLVDAGAPAVLLADAPTPGALGALGVTPAQMGLSPTTAAGISFALPPAAGAALGYFVMRSVLGVAVGAGGGLLLSLFLQQRSTP